MRVSWYEDSDEERAEWQRIVDEFRAAPGTLYEKAMGLPKAPELSETSEEELLRRIGFDEPIEVKLFEPELIRLALDYTWKQ